jgi:hypothetical protein
MQLHEGVVGDYPDVIPYEKNPHFSRKVRARNGAPGASVNRNPSAAKAGHICRARTARLEVVPFPVSSPGTGSVNRRIHESEE